MERDLVRARHELTQLIQKQIDAVELETFGGATDVECREYESRCPPMTGKRQAPSRRAARREGP
jgi:hypothetical protein